MKPSLFSRACTFHSCASVQSCRVPGVFSRFSVLSSVPQHREACAAEKAPNAPLLGEKHWFCNRFLPWSNGISNTSSTTQKEQTEDVVIIVNSELPRHFEQFWNSASFRICADGGANRLFDFWQGSSKSSRDRYIPHIIKGDLDSIARMFWNFIKTRAVQLSTTPTKIPLI